MTMRAQITLAVVMCMAVFGFLNQVFAEAEETAEFSYGTVTAVGNNDITVNEYDYDSDAEIKTTFAVTDKTEFRNATSLKDINVGDDVDIVYSVVDGKKIADAVTVGNSFDRPDATENSNTKQGEFE